VKMNTLLSNWTKQDLYSLMTKDIFFSACLIKGLSPKCPLKNTIIVEVIKHINKLETSSEDDQLYNSSNSNMPIYSFVSNLIQVDAESKKLLSPMKQVGTTSTKTINNPPYNPNPNRYNNNRSNNYNPKVEQASVSEVPEQVYENFNLKPFDKEITKSNNIFIKFNNRLRESIKKPYVALKTASLICPKCYPEDKSSTIPPCSNKCFAAQCQRCFLYGHATNLCLQSHDKDGKLLPKKWRFCPSQGSSDSKSEECFEVLTSNDNDVLPLTTNEFESLFSSVLRSFVSDVDITEDTSPNIALNAMLSSTSSPNQLIIKFDSACSRNMSGNPSRLTPSSVQPVDNIRVKGFNNTISPASSIGLNEDDKSELLVPSMPSNLVLLSAHDYAKDGCALLFKDFGFLIKLTESEKESFIQSLVSTYPMKLLI
jgi:hypothetical protein